MPFPYFERLSARQQKIYLQSDRVGEIRLPQAELLRPLADGLQRALLAEDRRAVELAAGYLARAVTDMLRVPPVAVQVLAVRPRADWGELHGLYTHGDGRPPRIQLWMRTAAHKRVVAFRTFLRTLVHEVGHHLDYGYLKLGDSLHTEGFFRRESSLVRQILGEPPRAAPARPVPDDLSSTRRSGR
jgi:hypothetical protein